MNETVTLEQMLASRDARAARQRALLAAYPGAALVSFLVNAPGPVKRTADAVRVFYAGRRAVLSALSDAGAPVLREETRELPTGNELFLAVRLPAAALKRICCALEASLPYGRLLDLDVLDASGHVSRTALGYPERGCMVCGAPGAACSSRRLHALPEILAAFKRLSETCPEEHAVWNSPDCL